jgi:hypothetical protein
MNLPLQTEILVQLAKDDFVFHFSMRRQQKKIIIAVASLYIRCAERKENPVSKGRHRRIEDSKTGADVVDV